MSAEQEFDRRIATIHGITRKTAGTKERPNPTDIRHEEFQAMAEVFLGKGYDEEKLRAVEDLQMGLHKEQAALYRRYGAKQLRPKEYVNSVNALIEQTFTECEQILGANDFVKLFGARPKELGAYIDPEAFLAEHRNNRGRR